MNFFQSIKFRFLLACVAFAIIVTLCYGYVTFLGLKYNADELFNWHIAEETTKLIDQFKTDPNLDISRYTTAKVRITTEAEIIKELSSYFPTSQFTAKTLKTVHNLGPVFDTPQGYTIYEYYGGRTTIHILEASLEKESPVKFYYLIDVTSFRNYDNYSETAVRYMFLEMLAVIVFIALAIAIMLAKTVVSPLSKLAKSVDNMDYSTHQSCRTSYFNDEIALLAEKIDSFAVRTRQFIAREKNFTRDASHELRTPLASSRAAIELALSTPEGKQGKVHNFIKRVERSNKDMTHLIETFLMLGREEDNSEAPVTFNLYDLVSQAFAKHDYLKRNQQLECVNDVKPSVEVTTHKAYLSIILDNLIRNALQHTNDGQVTVTHADNMLVVTDTGEGFEHSEKGQLNVMEKSGVGLSIVKRLCERQGWKLIINANTPQGTKAVILFK